MALGMHTKRMCHDVNSVIHSLAIKRWWQCKPFDYFELKSTMITAFVIMTTMLFLCHWFFLYTHTLELLDTPNQILQLVK
jgi:hypothetical protein